MTAYPRGISQELLLSQVRNTMPYLFDEEGDAFAKKFPPADGLRSFSEDPSRDLSHFEYFRLCVYSHYLSCGTPVPTDVDNQIRQKLWPKHLPQEIALEMSGLVLKSRKFDFTLASPRFVRGAKGSEWENEALSGHLGEWFTLAAGAYGAFLRYSGEKAETRRQELYEAIGEEVNRHSEIFASLVKAGEGIACLEASACIAHNLGDLDRVMEMWELSPADPLRGKFHKLTVAPFDRDRNLRFRGRLWLAGELYKAPISIGSGKTRSESAMAFENHRHFALRKPQVLRRDPRFLIPMGPFFQKWGRTVGGNGGLSEEDFAGTPPSVDGPLPETIDALLSGWERLSKTMGYGRALHGILEARPEWTERVKSAIGPAKENKALHGILEMSGAEFDSAWKEGALRHLDEIPARAE